MGKAVWIVGDDRRYLDWIDDHPNGFVVNTRREVDPDYFILHRAECKAIRAGARYVAGAFTERGYSKVVAESVKDLRSLMVERQLRFLGTVLAMWRLTASRAFPRHPIVWDCSSDVLA